MEEGHKTALAFLGIFAFLGLTIFFQVDIGELNLVSENQGPENTSSQPTGSEQVQASTRYTDSFESELGSEYVFDIETRTIKRLRTENGREYYQASLSFELTDFGERIAEAESEQEVRSIVEESFESYPEGDFEEALMNDVRLVEQGEPHQLEAEALQGRIENIESSDQGIDLSISVEEGLSPQVKWGSFSTVWTMDVGTQAVSDDIFIPTNSGVVQTGSNGVVQIGPLNSALEDFEDGSTDGWTVEEIRGSASFSADNSDSVEGTYSGALNIQLPPSSPFYTEAIAYGDGLSQNISQGSNISASIKNDGGNTAFFFASQANGTKGYSVILDPSADEVSIGEDGSSIATKTANTSLAEWYDIEIIWMEDNSINVTLRDSSDTIVVENLSATSSTYSTGHPGIYGVYNREITDRIDNIVVNSLN